MRDAIGGPRAVMVHLWYTSALQVQKSSYFVDRFLKYTFDRLCSDVPVAASKHRIFCTISASSQQMLLDYGMDRGLVEMRSNLKALDLD